MDELAERIRPLEERTAKLPDAVKARFREDPDIVRLLKELSQWAEKMQDDEVLTQDLLDLAAREDELVEVWTKKLGQAEVETKISGSRIPGEVPSCRYCGAIFAVPDPSTARAAWVRLKNHVSKLHPKEWAAAQAATAP